MSIFKATPVVCLLLVAGVGLAEPPHQEKGAMKLRIRVGSAVMTATLVDSPTARDFVSLLPLTLPMKDLFSREKFGHLPRPLASGGERTRKSAVGQIVYWAPGQDLAIFYRDDGEGVPAPGNVVLATMDSNVEILATPGPVRVILEVKE